MQLTTTISQVGVHLEFLLLSLTIKDIFSWRLLEDAGIELANAFRSLTYLSLAAAYVDIFSEMPLENVGIAKWLMYFTVTYLSPAAYVGIYLLCIHALSTHPACAWVQFCISQVYAI